MAQGERRQLTVMFCDLVGSTMLSEQLDPEDMRDLMRSYYEACTRAIRRFDGYVAKYLGDGLLVYFGYPEAHENDAQRAVQAGLGIIEELGRLNRVQGPAHSLPAPLHTRIGIETGLVVLGEMGVGDEREPSAIVGETPNRAARIQQTAESDAIVIGNATYRLVNEFFSFDDLGPTRLKGVANPVRLYKVRGETGVRSRFEAVVKTGLTPLVGREEELRLLFRQWEEAKAGAGQVAMLSGEPGIGKSRLVEVLKEHAEREGATTIEYRCSPFYQQTAWHPVIEHLRRLLQWQREDDGPTKLEKLTQQLSRYNFPQTDTLALLADLLSLPQPEDTPRPNLSPQRQKQKTQEALIAWLLEEAELAPVLAVWEDLHWADPSTLELIGILLDQVPTNRLLILTTGRPEFEVPWGARSFVTSIVLGRLQNTQAQEMVGRVTGGKALPSGIAQQIVSKTDGVPLFVEELTKMVLESGLLREVNGN